MVDLRLALRLVSIAIWVGIFYLSCCKLKDGNRKVSIISSATMVVIAEVATTLRGLGFIDISVVELNYLYRLSWLAVGTSAFGILRGVIKLQDDKHV